MVQEICEKKITNNYETPKSILKDESQSVIFCLTML